MSETDVRITDLDLLSFIDSGDLFAIVDTGAINRTKKVEFDSISGQINDPLSGFVVAVSGQLQFDVDQLSGYILDVSGDLNEISGHQLLISGRQNVISGEVDHVSGELVNLSGHVVDISGDLDEISGHLITTSGANGIPIVFASKLIGLGLDVERTADGDVTVEVYKDGVASGQTITAAGSATTATSNSLTYAFAAGTKINFKTTAANGTTQSGRIVAYLRTT